jgi:uncharacterized RDD family membrane protein YckC
MKLRNVYRVLTPLAAVTPAGWYVVVTSPDPFGTFVLFSVVVLAGVALGIAATAYVARSRSRLVGTGADVPVIAGFWLRLVAFAVDWIGFGLVELILLKLIGNAAGWVGVGLLAIYFVGCWAATGQTVGMALAGVRVVRSSDGGKINWTASIRRLVGLVVAIGCLYVGVIWVAFEPRKRGWHDLLGGTLVVQTATPMRHAGAAAEPYKI